MRPPSFGGEMIKDLRFVTWKNCGLGIMILPAHKQAGFIFLIWSVVITWGDVTDEIEEEAK